MPLDNPHKATVKVHFFPGGDPNYSFDSKLLKHGQLTFKNGGGKKGYEIAFELVNADTTGFFFPKKKELALSAKLLKGFEEADCPDQGVHWDVFKALSVSDDRKTLTVENLNEESERFAFSLFVTQNPEDDRPTCTAIDPIGNNQNGGRWQILGMALVGAAIVGAGLYSCAKLGD